MFRNTTGRRSGSFTNTFLVTAYGWGAALSLLVVAGTTFVRVQQFYSPKIIAVVHVFTLGFLTQSLLGLHDLSLQSETGIRTWNNFHGHLLYVGFNGSLVWFLASMATGYHGWSLTLAATILGYVLIHAGFRQASLRFSGDRPGDVIRGASFVVLATMGFLGFTMAHNKWLEFLPAGMALRWVETHAVLGVGGWVGLFVLSLLKDKCFANGSEDFSKS
ncbi:MAG: hypothetical protein ABEK50_00285, partial [bacterium]